MTAQDIIDQIRQVVQETDTANTHASNSTILEWLNECTLQLCSNITTLPKESLTGVVAADTITLDSDLLRIDFASITDPDGKHRPLETIDFVNFSRMNPTYQDTADGIPSKLVRMTTLNWMMYPNPDTTYTGKAVTIIGTKVPAAMTAFTDTPAISKVLHTAYVFYGSWKFFLLLNNPERAAGAFASFDGLRKMNLQTATSTTGSLLALKMRL